MTGCPMELVETVTVRLLMRDGETMEEAKERLFQLMYDGLCNVSDHVCDFVVEAAEVVE